MSSIVHEIYPFEKIESYLIDTIDLLICGNIDSPEERQSFIYKKWGKHSKPFLVVKRNHSINSHNYVELHNSSPLIEFTGSILLELPKLLSMINIQQKNVLLDLTSLDHMSIVYLAKLLTKQHAPKLLFSSYSRPEKYIGKTETFIDTLTTRIDGVRSAPGYARRERKDETLCAFIGFEGTRFSGMIEELHNISFIIPVIAFPSGNPEWYNVSVWNSMEVFEKYIEQSHIYKCYSENIFQAITLLEDMLNTKRNIVLAPLGTRPHTLACALYANTRNDIRIVFDFAVENEKRTQGVSDTIIYNLTSFIKT